MIPITEQEGNVTEREFGGGGLVTHSLGRIEFLIVNEGALEVRHLHRSAFSRTYLIEKNSLSYSQRSSKAKE